MKYLRTIMMTAMIGVTLSSQSADYRVSPGAFTIEKALQEIRMDRLHKGVTDATLHLQAGTYRLTQPVIIRPEDNGTRLVADGEVIISGGVRITGWKRQGNCYVADVPVFNGRPLEFRQLWVNGRKAVRARDVSDLEQMNKILAVDKANETITVPYKAVRSLLGKKQQVEYTYPQPEMGLHEMWCLANLRIKAIQRQGETAVISFQQPESHIHFMHPWPSPMITKNGRNSAFYLTNDKAFLDHAGEWFLDVVNRKVYYIPLAGENMTDAEVEAPALETLLQVEGTPAMPVENVSFEGITFRHSTWMRPSYSGHAPLQAGQYMIEAYRLTPKLDRKNGDHKLDNQGWVGRPAAAVAVNAATDVCFRRCRFEHLAATGLDYHQYTKGGIIDHCVFEDIGGSGISAGSFGPEGFEAHISYTPTDLNELCSDLQISDNVIHNVANEDWGCIGIAAGYVRGIRILHNEISDVSYTGISMGWGWNQQVNGMKNNLVKGNLIHHYARHMYDTAGIYTLSCQPHTFVEENVVRDIYHPGYAHDPNHWFYLYTDEGSSYITVRNNWTPAEKFLKNANGPGNTWENNGPMVADSIMSRAGVRK